MVIAQQLYEGLPVGDEGSVGLITYMRTDSTHIAASALAETREYIQEKFGENFFRPNRAFSPKRSKARRKPMKLSVLPAFTASRPLIKQYLNDAQYKLYDLIWKRMVASQMANAIYENTRVDIEAKCRARQIRLSVPHQQHQNGFPRLHHSLHRRQG